MLVSASSFAFYILQENAGIIITVILLLLLDIILVFLIIWLKNRSFWLSKTSLYALMSFIFLTALWLLTDSPILQLYVSGSLRIVLLSFCSFMLMPIPLLVFINDALKPVSYTHLANASRENLVLHVMERCCTKESR